MDGDEYFECEPRLVALDNQTGTADLVYLFPGTALFRVLALSFHLLTSSHAANRTVIVKLLDALGVQVFAQAAPAVQAASLGVDYSFGPDVQPFGTAAGGFMGGPFVAGRLPQNLKVAVHLVNGDAGDALSNGRLLVHQLVRDTDPG